MKVKILFCLTFSLSCCCALAYSDSTVNAKDFKSLIGCWQGSLTYLDYNTNKPFSMPANITVGNFKKTTTIVSAITYPKEPNANTLDTIFISKDGRFLNQEKVKAKQRVGRDSLIIITETMGIDGNDNKPALIRHTYTLGKNTYNLKKEVQFLGQERLVLRNEYKFIRSNPCGI